jgi:hypothetical protein
MHAGVKCSGQAEHHCPPGTSLTGGSFERIHRITSRDSGNDLLCTHPCAVLGMNCHLVVALDLDSGLEAQRTFLKRLRHEQGAY